MRVVCFIPDFSPKQAEILLEFAHGAKAMTCPLNRAAEVDCDVAVVFGWYKYAYEPTMAKKPIIDRQLAKGARHLIVIESGFYGRGTYYQIGWDGFAGHADFCNKNSPPDRFAMYAPNLKPWKFKTGKDIVVCGQLHRDTQVQDLNHIEWCQKACQEYAAQLKKGEKLLFRPHPREENIHRYGIDKEYLDIRKLFRSLKKARLCVTQNSTTCVDSLHLGVKAIASDEGSILNQAGTWPGDDAHDRILDAWRLQFFNDLSYALWTREEIFRGRPWAHLNR